MNRRRTRSARLAVLAALGFVIAAYLTAFQLGAIHAVWDPVFGSGSERVLTSGVSRLLPVPDASLGAAVYLVDLVLALGLATGLAPWSPTSTLLAIVATLGGLASIVLVVLQPLVAGAFCSLCLASAAISIALALGALAEAREARAEPSHRLADDRAHARPAPRTPRQEVHR